MEPELSNADVLRAILTDINGRGRKLPIKRIALLSLLIIIGLVLGLTYAWVINPVEWVAPEPTVYAFETSTQEIVALGIVSLAYQTRNEQDKSLINNTLADLEVSKDTLCSIHNKFTTFWDETSYALALYGISCG